MPGNKAFRSMGLRGTADDLGPFSPTRALAIQRPPDDACDHYQREHAGAPDGHQPEQASPPWRLLRHSVIAVRADLAPEYPVRPGRVREDDRDNHHGSCEHE